MLRAVLARTTFRVNRVLPAAALTCNRQFAIANLPRHDTEGKPKQIARKVAKIKRYWFFRYIDYIANYDQTLEKTFPRMMHVYRLISNGTKDLYVDMKRYVVSKKKEAIHGDDTLSSDELILNYTMPRDLVKITPVLLILAIPFTNYVLFPMAYFFPRAILTSHYWTEEQRNEFRAIMHKKRRKYLARVLHGLEQHGKSVKSDVSPDWKNLVHILRQGRDPVPRQVLACKALFEEGPFALRSLRRPHLVGRPWLDVKRELLLFHGMSPWVFYKREALVNRGKLLKRMDKAIIKEGGPSKMTPKALKVALSFRGIDPTGMSDPGMQRWMEKWLQVSAAVDNKSISLLLHCPVLLAYNWNTC